ncbi:glycosyltransferase [Roseibacterium sp. SDUM158017]|uniref:glycosyltransferase n=1 Tax=Roseicyclus salinarum TaxID=3036773 RepID=UPI00241521B9|nr:glycosyltransferase [Roseibacterium sp. SDUM158017]MDG4650207.1 glycosyltransferase [Roseibacterium sp. SDUM158017]
MTEPSFGNARIAVFLPCLNEEMTIGPLVREFRAALPSARIVVYDNLSTDRTAERAREAGAEVVAVQRRGKGNVVGTAFADIEADVYVMADGDGTYAAHEAPALVRRLVEDRLDMVIGRREGVTQDAGRAGHAFGNRIFNAIFRSIFGDGYEDILSGYRVFSRRFAKSFPALSTGFEIETELSVHALQLRLPVAEMPVSYGKRPEGSRSKLSTFHDGTRILSAFLLLMKEVKPLTFFSAFALVALFASFIFGIPVLNDYFETGLVDRMPTWMLTMALMILAFLLFTCGLILDSVARGRLERKRLAALAIRRFEPVTAEGGAVRAAE